MMVQVLGPIIVATVDSMTPHAALKEFKQKEV
jgi:hypothetical protein